MLRYHNYNIVFQEIPNEVTLAINISNCPNGCKGCHSPHLQEDKGDRLDKELLNGLLGKYNQAITCICFMGGDADPHAIEQLAAHIKETTDGDIKTAWYSGKSYLPETIAVHQFDYIKLGPYVEALGGLDSPSTNQRFYRVDNGQLTDCTGLFTKQ